ncbi:c9b1b778-d559-4fab-887a-925af5e54f94 [Thermothielavioides terrestris]|uniref:C9b1b778-d559-4fab-887a-925af5e54f94 n=1 Tax=Thermothielavioides terrestris TaxID=2587410 RepID=A0A446BS35_9PEZI|nr:c9b1b778-d559-4fab-887a-925af5e54f94 [Thermothielavioides terrestris]
MASLRAALVWATVAAVLSPVAWAQAATPTGPSIPMVYCATVNTADMVALESNFQSDGRCFGNCTTLKYALAIVQDHNCWCSNLIPNKADRKDLSDCENPCPGYPTDYCGGDGLFGYMSVSGFTATGTAPAGYSATPDSSSSDTSTAAVQTVTIGGTVKTVTATLDPTSTNDAAAVQNSRSGLQTGAVVGIVIGVVGGLAVITACLWLWFSKRRRQNEYDDPGLGSPARTGSSPGAMGTPKPVETGENRYAAAGGGWDASARRRSHLMPVDPRLDPFAKGIYTGDRNRSRESIDSLQDNQDYSRRVLDPPRVLRATNPDPDDD